MGNKRSKAVAAERADVDFRITLPMQAILAALLREPLTKHYGLEMAKAARLPSGTIYPALARLEAADWLESEWEKIDQAREGRRRRRYYRLTPMGAQKARQVLERTKRIVLGDELGEFA